MKNILKITVVALLLVAAGTSVAAEKTDIKQTVMKSGSQASFKGPEPFFTGNVKGDMLFSPTTELPASGAYVTFEAGARTAWHTHPAGQTLVVISGIGLTQQWAGPIVEIHPGDVVRCPTGVKHWHGAAPGSTMTHLAITGDRNGKNVEWLEKVTKVQYQGK